MMCPSCLVQMHQFQKVGGGQSDDDKYVTWEVKECPTCSRKVVEYYEARVIDELLEGMDLLALINKGHTQ